MKIYDISQELFDCVVFPGDPAPERELLRELEKGDICQLTAFRMCAHNGTHVDAPLHFLRGGASIDQIPLSKTIGEAFVAEHHGVLSAEDARQILKRAGAVSEEAARRILLKGKATVSLEAAEAFGEAGIVLIGNESQTVGPEDAPVPVHYALLGRGVVLLEGIRLGHVPEGSYLLNAVPINLGGAEGAPCRAVLLDLE